VVLNMSSKKTKIPLLKWDKIFSTHEPSGNDLLMPFEGRTMKQ